MESKNLLGTAASIAIVILWALIKKIPFNFWKEPKDVNGNIFYKA